MIRTTIKDRETNAKMFMETVGNFSKIFAIHIHRNHGGRCQFVYYPTGISGGIVIAESTVYGIEGCWIELISFLKGGIQQTTYYDDGFYDWIRKTLHWDCVYHDPEVILFKLR